MSSKLVIHTQHLNRLSIYQVMFFDSLIGSASFAALTMLGLIGPGKGLGGAMLCGVLAVAVFVFVRWKESDLVKNAESSPLEVIAYLGELLRTSAPGDPVLSGILIALDLAYRLDGAPPKGHDEMLKRLRYGRLLTAYEPISALEVIDPQDVENAYRYYAALCIKFGYRLAHLKEECQSSVPEAVLLRSD